LCETTGGGPQVETDPRCRRKAKRIERGYEFPRTSGNILFGFKDFYGFICRNHKPCFTRNLVSKAHRAPPDQVLRFRPGFGKTACNQQVVKSHFHSKNPRLAALLNMMLQNPSIGAIIANFCCIPQPEQALFPDLPSRMLKKNM
jgi:hypothetical protein